MTLERERSNIVISFKKVIKSTAEVISGFYATREADFGLFICARSMKEYQQFARQFPP